MNRRPAMHQYRFVLILLTVVTLSTNTAAEAPSVSVVSKISGPVGISDLNVLLDEDLKFQIFDFETKDDFCLALGYVHEIEGRLPRRSPHNEILCNVAGPQRLIVTLRPAGDKQRLLFASHHRGNGSGSTRAVADLPISAGATRVATFFTGSSQTISSDREVTLFFWRFGPNPPHPGPRDEIRILARLEANESGVRSYARPNDFSQ